MSRIATSTKAKIVALFAAAAPLLSACGPSPQETARQESARQIALANARRAAALAEQETLRARAAEAAYAAALLRGESPARPATLHQPPQSAAPQSKPPEKDLAADCKEGAKNGLIGLGAGTVAVCVADAFISGGVAFCAPMVGKVLLGGVIVTAAGGCAMGAANRPSQAYTIGVPIAPAPTELLNAVPAP